MTFVVSSRAQRSDLDARGITFAALRQFFAAAW
jgi:hypothetical protein